MCHKQSSMNCLGGTPSLQLAEEMKTVENAIALALEQAPVPPKVPPWHG